MMKVDIELTPKQNIAMRYLNDHITSEVLFGGSAGGGKSWLGVVWLITNCIRYPGTRWLMGRSKLKALKQTTLMTFFDVCSDWGLNENHYKYNQQNGDITFWNGSSILLKDLFSFPSDPNFDGLGSLEITGAFIDEVNQISHKAKSIVKSRIRYKLDKYNLMPKLLMTCNPSFNWTYTEFYKPNKEGSLPKNKQFLQALLSDNKHISEHYRDNLLSLDRASKERLLYGNWEYNDDPDKLIDYDNIINLWSNSFVGKEEDSWYISADIARMGADKAVIILWNGLVIKDIIALDISKLQDISKVITDWKNEYNIINSHIIADADGVGGFLVDHLNIEEFINNSRALNNENYQNLKTQCYYKLSELIMKNEIYIEIDVFREEIIEELQVIKRYKVDEDNKLRVLPKKLIKELIGRSPDYSDAIMMRMKFEIDTNNGEYNIY